MTSVGPESEELLGPTRRPLSPRVRRVGLVLAAAAATVGVLVYAWPDSSDTGPIGAPSASSTPRTVHQHPPPASRPWPTAPAACGSTADLPLVEAPIPVGRGTGLSVLAGSTRLVRVDFDTGRLTPVPGSALPTDEYLARLAGDRPTYAVALNCRGPDVRGPRLLRLTESGALTSGSPRSVDDLLIDGSTVWGLRWSDSDKGSVLVRFGGKPTTVLPRGFAPWLVTDGLLIGNLTAPTDGTGPLVLVDATTGAITLNLGPGTPLAAADGRVVWTTGCEYATPTPCHAHRRDLATGETENYELPSSPGVSPATLSPDHRLLAFTLQRRAADPRFENDHPLPPTDVAVLHLDSGALDLVPGIELPSKTSPAFGFSADGWLVIALDAGRRTRLLAWRPGMSHPFEAPSVPGLASSPPAVLVLPRSPRITDGGTGR